MKPDEYIKEVLRLASPHYDPEMNPDLVHSVFGCVTEAGELLDVCKRAFFYGKGAESVDVVNLKEEFGDLLWYIALGVYALDSSFEEIMEANIKKLKARYPEKFTSVDAHERDLSNERRILESGLLDKASPSSPHTYK